MHLPYRNLSCITLYWFTRYVCVCAVLWPLCFFSTLAIAGSVFWRNSVCDIIDFIEQENRYMCEVCTHEEKDTRVFNLAYCSQLTRIWSHFIRFRVYFNLCFFFLYIFSFIFITHMHDIRITQSLHVPHTHVFWFYGSHLNNNSYHWIVVTVYTKIVFGEWGKFAPLIQIIARIWGSCVVIVYKLCAFCCGCCYHRCNVRYYV